ncbi:hypothetical protein PVK06_030130 [Gossypium arboreum]|uniref:Uncharacterized protein n=1 Tax=Gossypium arboreum TaxID=29729 RepID=A0ABR0NMG7_GOSAR|nr:hypothetical protein PVK06_030130 [Gossypium arboreum]
MVVPPHTTRIGQYFLDPHHAPAPEPEPEPEPEAVPDPERRPEPELHSGTSSYHPDLGADDYFPGSSAQGYYSDFDIFSPLPHLHSTPPGSYPPSYSTLPGPYPAPFSTPPGSSSSVALETFSTPLHMDEENVDRRSRPQRTGTRGGQGHVAGCRGVVPLQQERLVAPPGLARPVFDPTEF